MSEFPQPPRVSAPSQFRIYRGARGPDPEVDRIRLLGPPPPWRVFDGAPLARQNRDQPPGDRAVWWSRAVSYQVEPETVTLVNVALHLRRPLLVTGYPGTGKSALAYAVAHELRLGQVLRWPITSRSVLRNSLYRYDAVGRIEAASLAQRTRELVEQPDEPTLAEQLDIGRFLTLGPLGTALAPYELPRVLLIDEIDKSDVDLPNDLLDVFEEGGYEIPELARIADSVPEVRVRPDDGGPLVPVVGGRVRCHAFPFIVMTSNEEREFPPAFLRRCLRLDLSEPDGVRTRRIVEAHLGPESVGQAEDLIREFLERRARVPLATDQLLNAVYLLRYAGGNTGLRYEDLVETVLRQLETPG